MRPGQKGSDPQATISGVDRNIYYLEPTQYPNQYLESYMISNQFGNWLASGSIPTSSDPLKYMYMIHFPSGISMNGFCTQYCGYHSYYNYRPYSVLPWSGDCLNGCSKREYVYNSNDNICGVRFLFSFLIFIH